jgi:hypothetical protein
MSKAIKHSVPIHISQVESVKEFVNQFLSGNEFEYIGSIGKKEFSSDVDVVIKTSPNFFKHVGKSVWSGGLNIRSIPLPFNGKTIQLDLFFTENMEWSKFILLGNKQRNQLLMAHIIASSKVWIDEHTFRQFNIRVPTGLWGVTKTVLSEKGNLLKNAKILNAYFSTDNPNEICKQFGLEYDKCLNFEDLWEQVKDNELTINRYKEYQK